MTTVYCIKCNQKNIVNFTEIYMVFTCSTCGQIQTVGGEPFVLWQVVKRNQITESDIKERVQKLTDEYSKEFCKLAEEFVKKMDELLGKK